jgi:hypothetical protein
MKQTSCHAEYAIQASEQGFAGAVYQRGICITKLEKKHKFAYM